MEVTNITRIGSHRGSQMYSITTSIEVDGNALVRHLQSTSSQISAVIMAQKSGKSISLCTLSQSSVISNKICFWITWTPADYCNCCDYSKIKVQPLFSVMASFQICIGSYEAPQACSCSSEGVEVKYNILLMLIKFSTGIINSYIRYSVFQGSVLLLLYQMKPAAF